MGGAGGSSAWALSNALKTFCIDKCSVNRNLGLPAALPARQQALRDIVRYSRTVREQSETFGLLP